MTSLNRLTLAPALLASALGAAALLAPAPAAAESGGRAVSACRAEMLSRFPEGTVRSYRVADISGNSRRTRVTIQVTADRRYTFECAAGADGRIVTAAFDPPRGDAPQIAAGQR